MWQSKFLYCIDAKVSMPLDLLVSTHTTKDTSKNTNKRTPSNAKKNEKFGSSSGNNFVDTFAKFTGNG
jgi:hypothetical protein